MALTPWTIWIILAAVLAVAEMMTGTFYLLVVALAAVAGGLVALTDAPAWAQIATAAAVAAIGFIVLRVVRPQTTPLADAANPNLNMDVGTVVRVHAIDPEGTVRVDHRGAQWQARIEGATLTPNTDYRIARVEGVTLILHPLN